MEKVKLSGQALVEFTVFIGPVVTMLFVSAKVLRDEWNQAQCAYITFESTHAARIGRSPPQSSFYIELTELGDRWIGIGNCSKAREEVELPKLESAEW